MRLLFVHRTFAMTTWCARYILIFPVWQGFVGWRWAVAVHVAAICRTAASIECHDLRSFRFSLLLLVRGNLGLRIFLREHKSCLRNKRLRLRRWDTLTLLACLGLHPRFLNDLVLVGIVNCVALVTLMLFMLWLEDVRLSLQAYHYLLLCNCLLFALEFACVRQSLLPSWDGFLLRG